MSELRPGDRALVVRSGGVFKAGRVVDVSSPPYWVDDYCGAHERGRVLVVDSPDFPAGRCATACLMRLPPDSEMRQMFRETSKPRETA